MICVDTNVLLRWLMADDAVQKVAADRLFQELTKDAPGFITSVTMVETCWVLRSVYAVPTPRVLDVLEGLLSSDELDFDDAEGLWQAVLLARQGADFPDAVIDQAARQFGCAETVTFDRTAARVLGMRLLS